ncbi:hypothetical protein SZN_09251 [Streptomyces zinciresistens K42]|uniref:Uncharacterized protein n=1 Tax=Streptomyces zinciresistens K42 TaxID=700597 RepID=G2G8N2_9ACTN|nr:hypothetical protein [Streptomyces zinciresistens]EGX60097.1 hypothetical protein SZN_09251 [Streptomyces zinciresistens K42]
MRDAYSNVTVRPSLPIAARTAAANGASVDRYAAGAAYQDAMIVVHTGAITDGTHAIDVQDSDDNSSWASVPAAQLQGAEPSIGSTDDDKVYVIGYKGAKRYLRVAVTPSGTTSGGVYGASVMLANPRVAPAVHS